MGLTRANGRAADELRPVRIVPGFTKRADGSVLIEVGDTRVVCTASREDRVPPFLKGSGKGWVTAEYGMLPASTNTRMTREVTQGRPSGRTQEIQRLIGRALRSVVDTAVMGEQTLWIDCDVLQADGSTRCASITGAFVAMGLAMKKMVFENRMKAIPIKDYVSAVSVGVVAGEPRLDLDYQEDSMAEVDMNIVQTGVGNYVEVQGTAEGRAFGRPELDQLLALACKGNLELVRLQREVLKELVKVGHASGVLPR